MKYITPDYMKNFRCKAGKCKDNCCIGWEIDIDNKTNKYYDSVEGSFGERLKNNISDGCFILDSSERCPFLNSDNLCDIFINLGEEHLCQICTDHPRYYEWFKEVKEGGIGLSCEEAARIILSYDMNLNVTEIPDESCDDYDENLHNCLFHARNVIFEKVKNSEIKYLISSLIDFGTELQYNIDNEIYEIPEWKESENTNKTDIRNILKFYSELEPIDNKWIPYIKKCSEMYEQIDSDYRKYEIYIRRLIVYFIFRYFLKGTFDGEIFSRIMLAVVSAGVTAYLWACEETENGGFRFEKCCEIAKNYSKETEYCEENIEALREAFYSDSVFNTEEIKGLLIF